MDKIDIYIASSDKTNHILNATIHLYDKYWPNHPKIHVLGFSAPVIDKDYEFHKLADIQENVNKWSIYIYEYLKTLNSKYIFLALDDFFPIDYINIELFNKTLEIMENNDKYVCCNVGIGPSITSSDKVIYDSNIGRLFQRHSGSYKLCLQPSIWKLDYLLKYLKTPVSPWGFELSLNANNDQFIVLGASSYPLYHNIKPCILPFICESSLTNRIGNKINVLGLCLKDISDLVNLGYINKDLLIFGMREYKTSNIETFKFEDIKYNNPDYEEWYNKYNYLYQI